MPKAKPKTIRGKQVLFIILHTHAHGTSVYVYSTDKNRTKGYEQLLKENKVDLENEKDSLELFETLLDIT